jgi:predicted Zn-dependent peptidase
VDELLAKVDRVTAEDVRRVAEELIGRDRLSLVALGPSAGPAFDASDLSVEPAA